MVERLERKKRFRRTTTTRQDGDPVKGMNDILGRRTRAVDYLTQLVLEDIEVADELISSVAHKWAEALRARNPRNVSRNAVSQLPRDLSNE